MNLAVYSQLSVKVLAKYDLIIIPSRDAFAISEITLEEIDALGILENIIWTLWLQVTFILGSYFIFCDGYGCLVPIPYPSN